VESVQNKTATPIAKPAPISKLASTNATFLRCEIDDKNIDKIWPTTAYGHESG
jgi:hypothetical protein